MGAGADKGCGCAPCGESGRVMSPEGICSTSRAGAEESKQGPRRPGFGQGGKTPRTPPQFAEKRPQRPPDGPEVAGGAQPDAIPGVVRSDRTPRPVHSDGAPRGPAGSRSSVSGTAPQQGPLAGGSTSVPRRPRAAPPGAEKARSGDPLSSMQTRGKGGGGGGDGKGGKGAESPEASTPVNPFDPKDPLPPPGAIPLPADDPDPKDQKPPEIPADVMPVGPKSGQLPGGKQRGAGGGGAQVAVQADTMPGGPIGPVDIAFGTSNLGVGQQAAHTTSDESIHKDACDCDCKCVGRDPPTTLARVNDDSIQTHLMRVFRPALSVVPFSDLPGELAGPEGSLADTKLALDVEALDSLSRFASGGRTPTADASATEVQVSLLDPVEASSDVRPVEGGDAPLGDGTPRVPLSDFAGEDKSVTLAPTLERPEGASEQAAIDVVPIRPAPPQIPSGILPSRPRSTGSDSNEAASDALPVVPQIPWGVLPGQPAGGGFQGPPARGGGLDFSFRGELIRLGEDEPEEDDDPPDPGTGKKTTDPPEPKGGGGGAEHGVAPDNQKRAALADVARVRPPAATPARDSGLRPGGSHAALASVSPPAHPTGPAPYSPGGTGLTAASQPAATGTSVLPGGQALSRAGRVREGKLPRAPQLADTATVVKGAGVGPDLIGPEGTSGKSFDKGGGVALGTHDKLASLRGVQPRRAQSTSQGGAPSVAPGSIAPAGLLEPEPRTPNSATSGSLAPGGRVVTGTFDDPRTPETAARGRPVARPSQTKADGSRPAPVGASKGLLTGSVHPEGVAPMSAGMDSVAMSSGQARAPRGQVNTTAYSTPTTGAQGFRAPPVSTPPASIPGTGVPAPAQTPGVDRMSFLPAPDAGVGKRGKGGGGGAGTAAHRLGSVGPALEAAEGGLVAATTAYREALAKWADWSKKERRLRELTDKVVPGKGGLSQEEAAEKIDLTNEHVGTELEFATDAKNSANETRRELGKRRDELKTEHDEIIAAARAEGGEKAVERLKKEAELAARQAARQAERASRPAHRKGAVRRTQDTWRRQAKQRAKNKKKMTPGEYAEWLADQNAEQREADRAVVEPIKQQVQAHKNAQDKYDDAKRAVKDADSPEAKKAATAALKAAKKELKENPAPSKAELELLEQAEERAKERGDSDDSSAVSVPSVGGGLGGAFVAAMAAAAAAAKLVAAVRAAAAAAALLRGHWLIAPQGTAAAATDAEPCSPCKPPPTCRPPKKWVCEPTGEADTPMTPQQPGDTVEPEKKKEEEEEEETGEGKEPPKGGGGGGAPHTPPAAGGKRAPITPEHSGTVEGRRSTEEPGEGSRKPTPPTVDDAIKTPTVEGRRVLRRECDRLAKQAKADLEAGTGRIGELQARQTALDAAIVDAYNKARLGGSHSRRAAALIKRARRSIPRGGIAQRNAAVRLRNEAYGSSSGAMKQYGYSECVKLLSDGALDALERAMAAAEAQFAAANMALAVAAAADGTAGTPLDILTLITLWFKGKTHVELSALFRDMERILENYGDWVDDGPARVKALFDEALDVKKGFDSWSRLTEILDLIGLVGMGAKLAIGGAKLLFKAGTHLLRGSADDAARQLGRQTDQVSETVESLGQRTKPEVVAPDAVSESVPSGGGGRFTPDKRSRGGSVSRAGPDGDTVVLRTRTGRRIEIHPRKDAPPGWGETYWNGDFEYSLQGTRADRRLAFYHEMVHSALTPKLKPLAKLTETGYKRSHLYRYLEEALAEANAQLRVRGLKGLPDAMRFPLQGPDPYVSLRRVIGEAAGATIVVGGVTYAVSVD